MPKKTTSYRERLLADLVDPNEAANYLNAALEDSLEMFLTALRDVMQANQVAKVAKEAGVTRESLYRATSEIGNPTIDTLHSVLAAMRLKIAVESFEAAANLRPPAASGMVRVATTSRRSRRSHTKIAELNAAGQLSLHFSNVAAGAGTSPVAEIGRSASSEPLHRPQYVASAVGDLSGVDIYGRIVVDSLAVAMPGPVIGKYLQQAGLEGR